MSGNRSQSTTSTEPWSGQQPYLKDLFSEARNYYHKGAPDLTRANQLTSQAIGKLQGASGSLEDYIQAITNANRGYATGSLLDPANNPAFQRYLNLSNQSISRAFAENILPQLTQGAVAAGNIGSSRQGIAEALSAARALDAIQRNTAALTDAAYGRGLQATMQAQQLSPVLTRLGLLPAAALETAGRLQTGLDTQADDLAKARLLAYQQLVHGNYGATQTNPATYSGGAAGALGGAVAGAQVGSMVGGAPGATYGAVIGGLAGAFA